MGEQRGDEMQSQGWGQKLRREVKKSGGLMNEEGALQPYLGQVGQEEMCHAAGRWGTLSKVQCASPNGTALLFGIYPAFTMNVNK